MTIIVKKIEMNSTRSLNGTHLHGPELDELMTQYIKSKNIAKQDIISINIIDVTCGFITHTS